MFTALFFSCLLLLPCSNVAQVTPLLTPIQTNQISPIGVEQFEWACVANFELPNSNNKGKIKFLDTDKQGNIYVIDNNGFMYAFSGSDFSELWTAELSSSHIKQMKVSPDGKTIAICYDYIKAATKKLEVRNATNGRTLLKIIRTPICYDESYLTDVAENTTLYPSNIAYSPDGTKLAVWFKNHAFDEKKCIANSLEELIIMSPYTGDVYATKRAIPNDFIWNKCDGDYPFLFSADAKSLYVGNCRSEIAQYHTNDLKLLKCIDLGERFNHLLEELNEKGSKNSKFPFHELTLQPNGNLLTSFGKQGHVFAIPKDLSKVEYVTQNQGTEDGHFSYSPDGALAMFNSNHINLWNVLNKQPILYTQTPNAFDAQTVRFHPHKKAILVGTKRTIKILAACPISEIYICDSFTCTGHFLNPETSFAVRGKGRIYWAFDENEIQHKTSYENTLGTEALGFSSLFNNQQNIPAPSELRIKSDIPGLYQVFGGTKERLTTLEVLQNLPNWSLIVNNE